jgi:ubiquinone biosynthesis protein
MFKQKRVAWHDIPRLREITAVLAKYGLGSIFQRLKLPGRRKQADLDLNQTRLLSLPRRFRMAFEELGPTYVKLGQIYRPVLIFSRRNGFRNFLSYKTM